MYSPESYIFSPYPKWVIAGLRYAIERVWFSIISFQLQSVTLKVVKIHNSPKGNINVNYLITVYTYICIYSAYLPEVRQTIANSMRLTYISITTLWGLVPFLQKRNVRQWRSCQGSCASKLKFEPGSPGSFHAPIHVVSSFTQFQGKGELM